MSPAVVRDGADELRAPSVAPSLGLALVPALIVVLAQLVVTAVAGRPEALGSAEVYRAVMNSAVLTRTFGMFVAVVLIWWELRCRGSGRGWLLLAVVSGPLAYAMVAYIGALSAFPPPQAAYYAINPLFIAAVGSQIGFASVVEVLWRARRRSRGARDSAVITAAPVVGILFGFGLLFFAVLHEGGTTGFYLYQLGYRSLFS